MLDPDPDIKKIMFLFSRIFSSLGLWTAFTTI